jgi:DNA-binding Lrp family transcriptional regulator
METSDFRLLNDWQRDFPLQREPFAALARVLGIDEARVLAAYRRFAHDGAMSRIGGIFDPRAGGSALLCAMSVPAAQLERVARIVSAEPGVNHNYEREHERNLWFVITGRDAEAVADAVDRLETASGQRALRLPLQHEYRIDLAFDLRGLLAGRGPAARVSALPVADRDLALAALVEDGLPLVHRPYDAWAQALARPVGELVATLQHWLDGGTLRRFGVIVRHHEMGFGANAMTVFDVPDEAVDRCGEALAREAGVTLAYRRARAAGWPYNLYCMVHGRDRAAVQGVLAEALPRCGLAAYDRAVLFSTRRFKQVGARRFRDAPEVQHAFA